MIHSFHSDCGNTLPATDGGASIPSVRRATRKGEFISSRKQSQMKRLWHCDKYRLSETLDVGEAVKKGANKYGL